MPTTIDISELRVGYVLGAPIYDDKNVKLLGRGVTIAEKFICQLRRRGIRSVHVTEDDLAKLRGWKLSVDLPSELKVTKTRADNCELDSRVDQARFCRYLTAISQVGRRARLASSPLKRIRESAQLAADALRAEQYGFGLTFPDADEMSVFLGTATLEKSQQKLSRQVVKLAGNRSLLAVSMTSDSPLLVKNFAADARFSNDLLSELHVESAAAAPLHRGTLRAGSIAVFFQQAKTLDEYDLSFLETIANILTVPTDIDYAELNALSDDVDVVKTSQRYDYRCWQSIAPMDGERTPLRSAYEDVLCRDISVGGFSFYYPHRPEFTHLAVVLGKPPYLKQMKATVVSCCTTEVDDQRCVLVGCRFAGPLLVTR